MKNKKPKKTAKAKQAKRGREIVCPSIGAAMGFIQAKLFHQGYLV